MSHPRTMAGPPEPLVFEHLFTAKMWAPWYPWDSIDVVDREYRTACWIRTDKVKLTVGDAPTKRFWLELLGRPPAGSVFAHQCERWGEKNRCIRHVAIKTWSENRYHSAALCKAAVLEDEEVAS